MNKDVNLTSITAKALLEQRSRLVSALSMFRPTVKQEEFFRAMQADQLLEIGVTGRNRGGKSVATAVWFASVVLDAPVTMRNGEKLYMRPERCAIKKCFAGLSDMTGSTTAKHFTAFCSARICFALFATYIRENGDPTIQLTLMTRTGNQKASHHLH